MKPPLTYNGITFRYLTLRDWCELTSEWLAVRQMEMEQAMRRSGADPASVLKAAQDGAARKSANALLLDMCKTFDGCSAILERSAKRTGIMPDALNAALEGADPDTVAVLAMRACGWDIKVDGDANQGNP